MDLETVAFTEEIFNEKLAVQCGAVQRYCSERYLEGKIQDIRTFLKIEAGVLVFCKEGVLSSKNLKKTNTKLQF